MENRLISETSPYLLQHAHNPVNWFPWGKEALEKAKSENLPIFLSIGYSACHWCHVMEKESFLDPKTAEIMNRYFVNIKVDREERPDLDNIYMSAVQMMTQHGGWPMSVFLTPDLQPFFGGTYFPPEDRHGMPSFQKILMGVAGAWKNRPDEILRSAKEVTQTLQQIAEQIIPATQGVESSSITAAINLISTNIDSRFGGLGSAPKFFHTPSLRACLREAINRKDPNLLHLVNFSLDHIARGGIYDHLGGGFHRYSTDAEWLVPHFEKMLYDNALLPELFLEAFQIGKNPLFSQISTETLDYILKNMTSPEGGFFSTEDADTEHEEGKFYVWTISEVRSLLTKELADAFCEVYDVSEEGNWERKNILRRKHSFEQESKKLGVEPSWLENDLTLAKKKLLAARNKREKPFCDKKIIVSWNGLMIHTLAFGYQVLGEQKYLHAAQQAANFILRKMKTNRKTLFHSNMEGKNLHTGMLDDYTHFIQALVSLYEADFNPVWLNEAKELSDTLIREFWDKEKKVFYFTPLTHEALIVRPKENHDGATPSGSSIAILALLRLGHLLMKNEYLDIAYKTFESTRGSIEAYPTASGQLLIAGQFILSKPQQIVFIPGKEKEENDRVLSRIRNTFLPDKVLASTGEFPSDLELLKDKKSIDGLVTLYVCKGGTCKTPLVGEKTIIDWLEKDLPSLRA